MHGILLDIGAEVTPDGPSRGFRRVGRSHDLAILGDGVVSLQHRHEDGARRHKLGQAAVETLVLMNRIEARGVARAQMQQLGRGDSQTGRLETPEDFPNGKFAHGIRFDNRKSSFGHCFRSASAAAMVDPSSAGLFATRIPARSKALILSAAVPCPPAMIAPACPMRLPGGAVCPATKAMTGLVTFARMYSAACSSAAPPISPIKI